MACVFAPLLLFSRVQRPHRPRAGQALLPRHETFSLSSPDSGTCRTEQLLKGKSWGSLDHPDELGVAQQLYGMSGTTFLPLSTPCDGATSVDDCCRLCSRRLGCTAFNFFPDSSGGSWGTCCLRSRLPVSNYSAEQGTAGLLHPEERCNTNCTLPASWPSLCQAEIEGRTCLQPAYNESANAPYFPDPAFVNLDDVPWVKAMRDKPAPEPPKPPSAQEAKVAVCAAGAARTLVHPLVYSALYHKLLEEGKHDLYLALGTSPDEFSPTPGHVDAGTPSARSFEVALKFLSPIATRFYLTEPEPPCSSSKASRPWRKWSACVDLVLKGPRSYDFMLRTRPDMLYTVPMYIGAIAAQVQADDVVITQNDWHMLIHRSLWESTLATLAHPECDMQCCRRPRMEANSPSNLLLNEYLQMIAHVTSHGGRHIETWWPPDPTILHYVSNATWLSAFRDERSFGRIARWSGTLPPNATTAARVVCHAGNETNGAIQCRDCIVGQTCPAADVFDMFVPARMADPPVWRDPTDAEWPPSPVLSPGNRAFVGYSEPSSHL